GGTASWARFQLPQQGRASWRPRNPPPRTAALRTRRSGRGTSAPAPVRLSISGGPCACHALATWSPTDTKGKRVVIQSTSCRAPRAGRESRLRRSRTALGALIKMLSVFHGTRCEILLHVWDSRRIKRKTFVIRFERRLDFGSPEMKSTMIQRCEHAYGADHRR